MNVKTMIPEAEVRLNDFNGENDIDLGEEISTRYEKACEEQLDELDFYMDLLEIGITVDLVRKYMGDEYANTMEMFCQEHGLE